MKLQVPCLASLMIVAALISGCGDASQQPPIPVMTDDHHGHDHHGHDHGSHSQPETLGAALHAVTAARDTIRDAFAAGKPEEAHGPLHDIFGPIEAMGSLADASDLSDEAKATIKANVENLLNAFGEVDAKLHKPDEGADYKDVSEKIEAALKEITTAAGPLASHDHDHAHGPEAADSEASPEADDAPQEAKNVDAAPTE